MAEERLQHYNLVLEEQLKRLQQEVSELAMPFVMMLADAGAAEGNARGRAAGHRRGSAGDATGPATPAVGPGALPRHPAAQGEFEGLSEPRLDEEDLDALAMLLFKGVEAAAVAR